VYLPIVLHNHAGFNLGQVIRSFAAPAGTQPNGLAWDGNNLWMSSYISQSGIYKLDPADGTVLHKCTPPVAWHEGYGGLAFDGTYLWQADAYGGGIYQLDPTDCSIVHTIPSPGNSPSDLAWDGQNLWVLSYPEQKMFKLDPTDGSIVDIFYAPSEIGQAQLAGLTYDGRFLWLSTSNYDLLKIDPSTGQVISSLLTTISRPDGLAWDGSYLWVASFDRARLYLVYVG
jgi:streptogramin lyase